MKKILKLTLIHNNKDKKLIKKFKKIRNKFIINKIKIIFLELLYFEINFKLKKKYKNVIIKMLIIWNNYHLKKIKKIIKNLLKINKNLKIILFKNIGNSKKFLKIKNN